MDDRGDGSPHEAGGAGIRAQSRRQACGSAEHSEARKGVHQVSNRSFEVFTYQLSVTTATDGTVTKTEIAGRNEWGDIVLLGSGEARRSPGDPRNNRIGQLLAIRRAFAGQVQQIDEMLDLFGVTVES